MVLFKFIHYEESVSILLLGDDASSHAWRPKYKQVAAIGLAEDKSL